MKHKKKFVNFQSAVQIFKKTTLLIFVLYITNAYNLTSLQKRKKQSMYTSSLPQVVKTIDQNQQQRQYAEFHQSNRFQEFQGDPVYNAKFSLTSQNHNQQSFFFIGMEAGQLKSEIQINNQFQSKINGIKVYLIDHTEKKIQKSFYVSKLTAFYVQEMISNLYQIKFVLDGKGDQLTFIQITFMMSLSVPTLQKTIDQPINQLLSTLTKTTQKIDDIFLDSLGEWDKISNAMKQQIAEQTSKTDMFLFEMIFIGIINLLSFVMLRRQMNKKILV